MTLTAHYWQLMVEPFPCKLICCCCCCSPLERVQCAQQEYQFWFGFSFNKDTMRCEFGSGVTACFWGNFVVARAEIEILLGAVCV